MAAPQNPALRREVINIYKELLNLGRSYPQGYAYFRPRLHAAFSAQAGLTDEAAIRRAVEKAWFVKREIEALHHTTHERRQRYKPREVGEEHTYIHAFLPQPSHQQENKS